ncbi:hypothetical protein HALDL1_12425 [Halobacterium sp. DL1]|jgi:hypothetical protein|nr:hypothetical protein HALDL1_12425 [Halobacterium sp. DL1]
MVAVTYYCPRCGAVAELDRDPYMADKSVTPFPLAGWNYVSPAEEFEADDADGVQLVCGQSDVEWSHHPETEGADEPGCGEPFYLNFVRFQDGEAVSGEPESEFVELAEGEDPRGPRGPTGPGFSR